MTLDVTRPVVVVLAFLGTSTISLAGESANETAAPPFQFGGRVSFVGDSITAWGPYTSILSLSFQTPYPDESFRIYHNAFAGDRAIYTRLRAQESGGAFHQDILRNQPNVAVVTLGMNDAEKADVWSQPNDVKQQRRPGNGILQKGECEFVRMLEEGKLAQDLAESIRALESLSDQTWKAAVPKKRKYQITYDSATESDSRSKQVDATEASASSPGFDLNAQRRAAMERRESLQKLLSDHLEKYPESDVNGDGRLTSPERSIHVAKLYRIDVLKKLGDSIRFKGDIEYARVGGKSLALDLYLPSTIDPENRPPLIVWFHGGGWRGGSKDQCDVHWLATNGFAVASVEYRSTLEAPFPNNIHDCKGAIRWLRSNADQNGYNADRIGTSGGSAGGHLAVILGTSAGVRQLEGMVGGNLDSSSRVHAAVSMAGVMRVDDWPKSHPGLSSILGLTHSEDNGAYELARLCSPDEHITSDDPAMLLFHGDNDNSVPQSQSRAFHTRYVKAGLTSTLLILRNTNHVSPNFTDSKRRRIIIDFFQRHLQDVQQPAQ